MLKNSAAVALLAVPLLTACATGPAGSDPVVIDGELDEWPSDVVARSDAEAVYFRFNPGEPATLQANDETTRLVFDLDADPETGKELAGPPAVGTLGVDLEILLTPPLAALPADAAERIRARRRSRGEPASAFTSGMTILRHEDGTLTRLRHADIGFMVSPTYASDWFEARLDRNAAALENTGIATPGRARGIVLITDGAGEVVRYSDPFVFDLPPAADAPPARADIPAQAPGTIRVLSMNVLRGKPLQEPAPFARLIAAVRPDVILFQEADDMTAESVESWLGGHVGPLPAKHEWSEGVRGLAGGVGAWDAAALPELGVAIATPHLVAETFDEPVVITDPESGRDRTVRVISALISTPAGDVLAGSTHMKCCGSAGSREDRIRYAEADAINARFAEIIEMLRLRSGLGADAWFIGGDLNLVGTRGPIESLGEGLGEDGADLRPVDTPVLGDNAYYTWRNDKSYFGPGRLDWILAGGAETARAFALDTRRIHPETLAAHALMPGDSAVSDHLPVVVDLRP